MGFGEGDSAAGASTVVGIEDRETTSGRDLTRIHVTCDPTIRNMCFRSAVYDGQQRIPLAFLLIQWADQNSLDFFSIASLVADHFLRRELAARKPGIHVR